MYLEKINSAEDIKRLSVAELENIAEEIRSGIINRDSSVGGHVGSNLGIVEATVALHCVFNFPEDKIVYDVSHQCYPHKMLTGRYKGFFSADGMKEISGYTNPNESVYDNFIVGHTSTSVSLATGLAKARDLNGQKHNVIALIGDGSLSGGEAFEGFNNAAELNTNLIIIVNDNEMSIAENHGGLYKNLRLLRETNGNAECNMFKALGLDYCYLDEGNSLPKLIDTFQKVKDCNRPIVVHIHTQKGKGYKPAEENKERWHWCLPFDKESGQTKNLDTSENYRDITFDFLNNRIHADKKIAVLVAGTPGALGLTPDRRKQLGSHYIDVGIAEEHAVAMASAMAKGRAKPVFMVLSSFIQRTYDQLSQDLALNSSPAVILVFSGAISSMDATHLGAFDISLISNIPNIVYLAPTTKEEYLAMLNWGLEQNKYPVVIRVPQQVSHAISDVEKSYDSLNVSVIERVGKEVAVFALGSFFELGKNVCAELEKHGISVTLVNPRYITGTDKNLLEKLKDGHKLIVTLEDGELDGGYGEKIARYYGNSEMKVLCYGADKEFTDREPTDNLYKRYHLTVEQITADILSSLK